MAHGTWLHHPQWTTWGKPVVSTGTMASVNLILYRGYYYNTESGLYYLGSRCYDPVVKRFINADSSNLITTNPGAFTDKNLFSYCDNNPTNRTDDGGEFWGTIIAGVVLGGITGAIDAAAAGESTKGVMLAAGKGALIGAGSALISTVTAPLKIVRVAASAAYSAGIEIASQKASNPKKKINWYNVATAVGTSLISSAVSGVNSRIVKSATKGLSKTDTRVVKCVTSGIKNTAIYTYKLIFKSFRNYSRPKKH